MFARRSPAIGPLIEGPAPVVNEDKVHSAGPELLSRDQTLKRGMDLTNVRYRFSLSRQGGVELF
jgi:hypothetical protein